MQHLFQRSFLILAILLCLIPTATTAQQVQREIPTEIKERETQSSFEALNEMTSAIGWQKTVILFGALFLASIVSVWLVSIFLIGSDKSTFVHAAKNQIVILIGSLALGFVNDRIAASELSFLVILLSIGGIVAYFVITMTMYEIGFLRSLVLWLLSSIGSALIVALMIFAAFIFYPDLKELFNGGINEWIKAEKIRISVEKANAVVRVRQNEQAAITQELTAIYNRLLASRAKLDPNNATAVTEYNKQVAEYEYLKKKMTPPNAPVGAASLNTGQ
jgi:hypothetical protein